ncbi:MAG: hypothetical protein IJ194_05980 [Bacilli bacterium]|nr:hypothetical protein [Bacilli bacterium]
MKIYTLNAVIHDKDIKFSKVFPTRSAAINYMFDYLRKEEYIYNAEVEEEYPVNENKHDIEYVLSNNNRFVVNRLVLG